jgi:hypothetical protein
MGEWESVALGYQKTTSADVNPTWIYIDYADNIKNKLWLN